MKKKDPDITYLTRAEWEAFKREEAEARMELVHRVERGEITAQEANDEAALIKEPETGRLLNLREHLEEMVKLYPVDYLPRKTTHHGRRPKKTVCTS